MSIMAEKVTAMRRFKKDSIIIGHHIYKAIWITLINATLSVETEEGNQYDKYAVSVVKTDEIVGHVPRLISKVCWQGTRRCGRPIGWRGLGVRTNCPHCHVGLVPLQTSIVSFASAIAHAWSVYV